MVAQHPTGLVDLNDDTGASFDRFFDNDIRDGLDPELGRALDMRAQHVPDDDRARSLDLKLIPRDDIGDPKHRCGDSEHEKEQERESEPGVHRGISLSLNRSNISRSVVVTRNVGHTVVPKRKELRIAAPMIDRRWGAGVPAPHVDQLPSTHANPDGDESATVAVHAA